MKRSSTCSVNLSPLSSFATLETDSPRFTERYFEMSHSDASEALSLYQDFCSQTKRVVEVGRNLYLCVMLLSLTQLEPFAQYLKYAKELKQVIDVPVPNLKHVSPFPIPV